MTSSASFRAKARGYLKQADSCGDEILADELRSLARKYCEEADRADRLKIEPMGPRSSA